jgi:hypothetical protein
MNAETRQHPDWQSPRLTVLAIQSDTKLGGSPAGYDTTYMDMSDS